MRRIFVGDVHGCPDSLQRLLVKCGFAAGDDELYCVGDLVNKGPDSIGVVRFMIDHDARCVLGNHDRAWNRQQRLADPVLARWLAELPIVRVLDDLIVVHAGLHPSWREDDLLWLNEADRDGDDVGFAINTRYCDASGRRPPSDWPPPDPPFVPWDEFYRGSRRVVFGHWARRGLAITERVIGLDSGCVYGGKLSAWIAEEERVVQVDGGS